MVLLNVIAAQLAATAHAAPLAFAAFADVLNASPGLSSFVGAVVGGVLSSSQVFTRRMDSRADRRVTQHERDCLNFPRKEQ